MTPFGIRKLVKKALGLGEGAADSAPPAWQSSPAPVEPPASAPLDDEPAAADEPEAPAAEAGEGAEITLESVQAVLDDMVRPALQGDGGDITLVKIEDQDIYVKLVGACSTCPSSIMTMKMGVEALLREEFPSMRELVQVP